MKNKLNDQYQGQPGDATISGLPPGVFKPNVFGVFGPTGLPQAKVGETVRINGENFSFCEPFPKGSGEVRFGFRIKQFNDAIRAEFAVQSDILITAKVPPGADTFPTSEIAVSSSASTPRLSDADRSKTAEAAKQEISRFPCKECTHMPGS
jgi:hypothetical protein